MAGVSFIGKPISLISHSDIRYRGILHGIDPAASTISLSNVRSMGTESRRSAEDYIPPSDVPYEFIIFRASEVKDLSVDQTPSAAPAPQRNVHDDPAVIGAHSKNAPQPYPQQAPAAPAPPKQAPPAANNAQQPPFPQDAPASRPAPPSASQSNGSRSNGSNGNRPVSRSVNGANVSLENVERAMADLYVSDGAAPATAPRSGGRSAAIRAGEINIPSSDFDFQKSNARFDKTSFVTTPSEADGDSGDEAGKADSSKNQESEKSQEKSTEKAYNPKASFFDSLSSGRAAPAPREPAQRAPGQGNRGRRGGPNRREEERQKNVATFGEPGGGPGLMGPGAYIPGWGGHGRRGQPRGSGRRGAPRGGVTAS